MSAVTPPQAYDLTTVQAGLCTTAFGRTLHYHESVPSTNAIAITLAQEGACHGTLVLADGQTAGRGRRGRTWHSPPGLNLYCSLILCLHPNQAGYLTIIPQASALAVADAIADATRRKARRFPRHDPFNLTSWRLNREPHHRERQPEARPEVL